MKLTIILLAVLGAAFADAETIDLVPVEKIDSLPIVPLSVQYPELKYCPTPPDLISDSPGILVGVTQYDMQSIGSTGRKIELDGDGNKHFTWTKAWGGTYPFAQKLIYFNYCDDDLGWLAPGEGQPISQFNGDHFPQLDLLPDNLAAITYNSPSSDHIIYAADNFPGMGIFNYYDPPDWLEAQCVNPYLTIDRNGHIHIVSGETPRDPGGSFSIAYTRSTNEGYSWMYPVTVGKAMTPSYVIVSSEVSDKVAIAYTSPIDSCTQWKNDIVFIESPDGLTWNWRSDMFNITEYGAEGDSLFAYTDVAAIYDYDDNLHIFWNALYVGEKDIYYPAFLYHCAVNQRPRDDEERDMEIGVITRIAVSDVPGEDCKPGAWNLPICKMSVGFSEWHNALFVVFTAFGPDDCSEEGFANGDIFMQMSVDNGMVWSEPYNITDTHTPGCQAGECESDNWATMAHSVDNYMHIEYINDKSPGAVPFGEGSVTDNSVKYLEYPVEILGLEEEHLFPEDMTFINNYPNPFNAQTTIEFELAKGSDVKLTVYDITGARVEILHDGFLEAGRHSVVWDAGGRASGTYFYKISTSDGNRIEKMVLLK